MPRSRRVRSVFKKHIKIICLESKNRRVSPSNPPKNKMDLIAETERYLLSLEEEVSRLEDISHEKSIAIQKFSQKSSVEASALSREATFIMVKPDGVQRGLVGEITQRFEQRGFKLVGYKMLTPPRNLLKSHYADLKTKKFFPGLIDYMSMGPVVAMVWEGDGVVATGRKLLGATMPAASNPGTIRGDMCIDVGRNICHGSDCVEAALAEIAMWFPEGLNAYGSVAESMLYEKVLD